MSYTYIKVLQENLYKLRNKKTFLNLIYVLVKC